MFFFCHVKKKAGTTWAYSILFQSPSFDLEWGWRPQGAQSGAEGPLPATRSASGFAARAARLEIKQNWIKVKLSTLKNTWKGSRNVKNKKHEDSDWKLAQSSFYHQPQDVEIVDCLCFQAGLNGLLVSFRGLRTSTQQSWIEQSMFVELLSSVNLWFMYVILCQRRDLRCERMPRRAASLLAYGKRRGEWVDWSLEPLGTTRSHGPR